MFKYSFNLCGVFYGLFKVLFYCLAVDRVVVKHVQYEQQHKKTVQKITISNYSYLVPFSYRP